MHYVEVLVASQSYHGSGSLTYASEAALTRGSIVVVPLRDERVVGVVVKLGLRPRFKTKAIIEAPALPPLPEHIISLMEWLPSYYPSPSGVITQHFLPKQVTMPREKPRTPSQSPPKTILPPLTSDQKAALAQISDQGLHLLHGATGSGKTRIYIELTKRALAADKSAIILTPEISLTSQLARDFSNVFGDAVIVIHSQLTEATRRAIWLRVLQQKQPSVIIGPRSALFMPTSKLGLIVVDEAHEPAYKQDQAPYYNTVRVASKLAALAHAPVVLGSATPLVTDYYIAEQKSRPIIRMQQVAAASGEVARNIAVVDLRDHGQFTKNSYLSDLLLQAIGERLARHEQTLLFLNRRGTARVVLCENCGWQATCPHCDLPLVYHGDIHRMRCHTCEYSAPSPTICPECNSMAIVYKSIGTKAIADEVTRLFPEANVQRFDADNKKTERIELHYEAIRDGKVDIIVGTQLLAKGLDLPNLGLVGVVLADTSMYMPDFTAQERTYQLLSQVVGRVGRGHRESQAIIQTYAPDSPVLAAVLERDWDAFYQKELEERRAFLFPPFCYLLKLTCKRATSDSARLAAEKFATTLSKQRLRVVVEGPAPAFHEKSQGKYAWQLHIKAKERQTLLAIISQLPSGWSYDIDPLNLI